MALPGRRLRARAAAEQPRGTADLYERRAGWLLPSLTRMLALLVVASVVTTAVGLLRYAPLTGVAPAAAEGASLADAGSGSGSGGDYTAEFRPDGSFEYRFTLRNAGRWGVTLTGVQPPMHPVIESAQILAAPPGSSSFAPITSFALGAGEQAEILVRVRFGPCKTPPPPESRTTWDHQTVAFRVLGVARQMSAALPLRITIDDAAAPRC